MGFATQAIHAGAMKMNYALTNPIYQSSTFVFDSEAEQRCPLCLGKEPGYIYSCLGNPSDTQVEEKALCSKAAACCSAASGMGAISSAL